MKGLYRRGEIWWMRFVYQGKLIRRSTETSNEKLAEDIYCKVRTQIIEGKWFEVDPAKEHTFLDLAEKYENTEWKKTKGWRVAQSYLNQLKNFFGAFVLADVTSSIIDDFRQARKEKGVKGATINRQLTILKRMFNLAKKRWGWIKEIPLIEMEQHADVKRTRHLSFDEYHTLLTFCEDWLKEIVTVSAWTGLRQGNVLKLKREQVNLFSKSISIKGEEMKNGKDLIIPISAPAYEVFKRKTKVTHLNNPYIFYDVEGNVYNKMKVNRAFKRALKGAGIEDFRFNDLRHCFASWSRQAGVSLDTLADMMGHTDSRMTRRYAHITYGHLTNATSLLEKSYEESGTKNTITAQSNVREAK